MSDDTGPPTNSVTSQSMTGTYPKYAETPMPFDEEEDETDQSLYEELEQPSGQSLLSTAVKGLVIAIIIAQRPIAFAIIIAHNMADANKETRNTTECHNNIH